MITNFFTTPVDEEIISINNIELVQFAYDIRKNNQSVAKSNLAGYQSDYLETSDPILIPLIQNILDRSEILMKYFNVKEILTRKLANMWININPRGGSNGVHQHPGSFISGVYYVQVPKNSGKLVFKHPAVNYEYHINSHNVFEWNLQNAATGIIVPQVGKLIVFPSYAGHYVQPNESDEDRISIAFNVGFREENVLG